MQTTLNEIRSHRPCHEGWAKLLRTLNKTQADDEPIGIVEILDSNGMDDALWCLRAVKDHDREIRLFAVWCARQVEHLMTDRRSKDALNVAERFAIGEAKQEELSAARSAAEVAAEVARSAWSTAEVAAEVARSTAGSAAWSVARLAAWAEGARGWEERLAQEKELRRICAEVKTK
jgi:hypothetical protein